MEFDHILNWKLKKGSHAFPGENGGTCINEAAIVAAGFKYQPVHSVEHMPACFSRPICKLAMTLNDTATDTERQQLIRFVTRLACADAPDVEAKRAAHIDRHLAACRSFQEKVQVLEGALMIGRLADDFAPQETVSRLDTVRSAAAARPSLLTLIRRLKRDQQFVVA